MYKINIATIIAMRDDGTLAKLFKAGLISSVVFEQIDVFIWVSDKIATGITKTQAVLLATSYFKKDTRTIHRHCSHFKVLTQTCHQVNKCVLSVK